MTSWGLFSVEIKTGFRIDEQRGSLEHTLGLHMSVVVVLQVEDRNPRAVALCVKGVCRLVAELGGLVEG